ncbi:helix-turn-helix transcriptional regulator [Chitinilyticum litopenaei]|uniref:helix-turn-helix transcriptional regulator n=1 Tax=Chitinilyticum litopenaei TaxID=1121276 RepID=UPI0004043A7C|nr:AlpA family phage regulatory protein [Chitinilyticum litopenaei]
MIRKPTIPAGQTPASASVTPIKSPTTTDTQPRADQAPFFVLIRLSEVLRQTGLSRSAWYASIAAGKAPKPVPLGGKAVAWLQHEVQQYIAGLVAARDQHAG